MQQDFVALQWVIGEIEQTSDQLGKELLAYADNLSDATRLRHALTLAHQVHATLRVVGLPSAEQLARETEEATQAMLHGRIPNSEANLQLLVAASLQLPGYLRRVVAERRESPLDVLGAVNDLRTARGEPLLPVPEVESALDLSELGRGVGAEAAPAGDDEQQFLRKARQRLQTELLGILRDDTPAARLQTLQKLFAMLAQRSREGGHRCFWQACAAACDAVVRGGVELDDRVRGALREIDNEVKTLIGLEQGLYHHQPSEPLYRHLLEIIARSRPASALLAEIQQRHRLVPSTGKTRALDDLGATGAAVAVIGADLSRVLGQLESTEGDATGISRVLREVEPDLQRIASLLAGLGYREEHEVLAPQLERIAAGFAGEDLDDRLTEITAALLDVDQRLAGRAVASGAEGADAEARRDPLSRAMTAVCREVQAALELTKQAITDYATTPGEVQVLEGCGERLHAASGALRLASLGPAAGVLADCRRYLVEVLDGRRPAPAAAEVDAFADALSSVEYFIERLLIDHVPAELILGRARATLAQLVGSKPLPPRIELAPAAVVPPVAESLEPAAPVLEVPELAPDEQPEEPEEALELELPALEPVEPVALEFGAPAPAEEPPFEEDALPAFIEGMLEPAEPGPAETPAVELVTEPVMLEPAVEAPSLPVAETVEPEPVIAQAVPEAVVEQAAEPVMEEEPLDPEIVEIFVEEAAEVLQTIAAQLPLWRAAPVAGVPLTELRRAFHTLKGSGRMVGAKLLGELAWSIENLLNRVIERAVPASPAVLEAVERAQVLLPGLVEAFAQRTAIDPDAVDRLREGAQALARGESVRWEEEAAVEAELPASEPLPELTEVEAVEQAAEPQPELPARELEPVPELELEPEPEPEAELELELESVWLSEQLLEPELEPVAELEPPPPEPIPQLELAPEPELELQPSPVSELEPERVLEPLAAAELAPEPELASEPGLPAPETEALKEEVAAAAPSFEEWQPELEPEELAAADAVEPMLQIFAREVQDHVGVLQAWCSRGVADVTDELMRCLHTLRGGMHLVGLEVVGQVLERIDDLVRTAGLAGHPLRAEQISLLAELAQMLEQLLAAGMGVDASIAARVAALHEQTLRLEAAPAAASGGVSTARRIERFLQETLEKLFHATTLLDAWRAGQDAEASRGTLLAELQEIHDKAAQLDMQSVLVLCKPLQGALRAAAVGEAPAALFDALRHGFETFLDTLDRLAAGQLPDIPASVIDSLTHFAALPAPAPIVTEPVTADMLRTRVARDLAQAEHELLGIFLEEAEELMAAIDEDIDAWRHEPAQQAPYENLQRSLHTLKGGARMAGLRYLGELSHNFETFLINQSVHFGSFDPAFFARVADFHEQLLRTMDVVRERPVVAAQAVEEAPAITAVLPAESIARPVAAPGVAEVIAPIEPEPAVPDVVVPIEPAAPVPAIAAATPSAADLRERITRELQQAEQELLGIFVEEAEELMVSIDAGIDAWRGEPAAREPYDRLQRDLHTLKGGARMASLATLGDLAHEFETLLINQGSGGGAFDASFFTRVAEAHEQLLRAMDAVKGRPVVMVAPAPVAIEAAAEAIPAEAAAEKPLEERRAPAAPLGPLAEIPLPPVQVAAPRGIIERPSPAVAAAATAAAAKPRDEVVRVSAQLLEDLVNLAGETAISRGRVEEQVSELGQHFEDMQGTIERLQSQVRRLDIATEAQILFRRERAESAGAEGFDPLEMDRYSQLQQLSRSLVESASDLLDIKRSLAEKARDLETVLIQQSRINSQLQEGLMRSRMVPFSSILPRIKRVVRQVAGELGKSVELELGNMAGELDRGILERIVAPLEHMLRNAVDHGIESREKRRAAGKPETGRIVIEIERDGGDVLISIADDGAGVNLAAVRAKAIERGLMTADSDLGDHEIVQFILHSGFSTATKVTQISGRGVGMDVVSSEIRQMGGSLQIHSTHGKGSHFTIRLPFTVSVSRALMVVVGGDTHALPLNTVAGVVRMHVDELARYDGPKAELFRYAGQHYGVRQLAQLLYPGEQAEAGPPSSTVPVVLVRGGGHNLAVKVDRLVGAREIVVKSLGPQFGAVPGLSGATVLGDGSVVVILDIPAMLRADGVRGALTVEAEALAAKTAHAKRAPLIMVVDDSVTVRKVTTRFLEREGMRVITAKDGADAMIKLQEQVPDLMLLDIEMPHMDGFEVVSKVRLSETLKHLPIIMITSRTGEKHRERALSLGANMYLGKPYQESVLLEHIDALLNRAAP